MKEKQLQGKGEFIYDFKHDILTFKIKDRDYKQSIELQNFCIDIDTENFVTGVRIFDVSKVSGLRKLVFRNLTHGKFESTVKNNIITVRLQFVGKLRNRIIPIFSKEENFTQQIVTPIEAKRKIEDSTAIVQEIIA